MKYEKDKKGEERGTSFIEPAMVSFQTFKSLKNNSFVMGRWFTVSLYFLL